MASIACDRANQYSKQNCQEKQRQFPSSQLGAVKLALKPSIRESLQQGEAILVILVVVRQVGSMEKRFFGLGTRKAAGRS